MASLEEDKSGLKKSASTQRATSRYALQGVNWRKGVSTLLRQISPVWRATVYPVRDEDVFGASYLQPLKMCGEVAIFAALRVPLSRQP